MATADDVRAKILSASLPTRPVTDEMIDSARGPIPWSLIAARIAADNPDLDSDQALGAYGGLCSTPIREAMTQFDLDLRDPWSSYLHLCIRLQSAMQTRLHRYGLLYGELFMPVPIPQFPHLWTFCYRLRGDDQRWNGESSRVVAAAEAICKECASGGDIQVTQLPRALETVLDSGDHDRDDVERAIELLSASDGECPLTSYPQLRSKTDRAGLDILLVREGAFSRSNVQEAACACCSGTCSGDAGRYHRAYVHCQGRPYPAYETVACNVSKPGDWPWPLAADWGFWALVIAEERLPTPSHADDLWDNLLSGGLPKLLAKNSEDFNRIVGYMMTHHDTILFRNLWLEGMRRLETEAIPNSAELSGALTQAVGIVASAYGRTPTRGDRVAVPMYGGGWTRSRTLGMLGTRSGVTDETIIWAGGRYTAPDPGEVVPPDPEPGSSEMTFDDDESGPLVSSPPMLASTGSKIFLAAIGAAAIGTIIWIWKRSNR